MNSNDSLIAYLLHLGDNALMLGHRNSEWCGHGPVLEQDIAITNISLDLIGQARNFYQYAASITGGDTTEDTLAYLRDAHEFRHCLMVEFPKGDWAFTILRQFLFSQFEYLQFAALEKSNDEQIAAIAVKSLKEISYHLRWSGEWVVRLGDGTGESTKRIKDALQELWPYTHEFFKPAEWENEVARLGGAVDPASLSTLWNEKVRSVFDQAGLTVPSEGKQLSGGKIGQHTSHLDEILKDLQYMQRAYPGSEW